MTVYHPAVPGALPRLDFQNSMQRTLTPVALRHYALPVNSAPMNVSGAWNEPAATNGDAHTVHIGSHDDRPGNLDDVNVGAASPSRRKRSIQRGLWLWWRTVAESISHCRGSCRACGVPRRRTIKRRLSLSLSSFTRSTVAMGSSSRSFSRRLSLPVAAVILLFVSVYVSTMRCTLLRWQGATPGQLALGACAFTLSATYALSCYVLAVVTDPGRVPYQWAPCDYGGGGAPGEGEEVKRKGSNQRRFCSKCHAFKPPRSHHCRRCQRCVLRMDHHCVWLNTCVGHCNYKVFILFISSTTAILFGIVAAIAFHLRAIAMSIASSRNVMGTRDERTGIVRMAMDVGDPFRLAQRFALAGTTRQCVVTELGVGLLSFCLAMVCPPRCVAGIIGAERGCTGSDVIVVLESADNFSVPTGALYVRTLSSHAHRR